MPKNKAPLTKISSRQVHVFKVKNRRSYAAICKNNLCEGTTAKQAIRRLYHPLRRMGYELVLTMLLVLWASHPVCADTKTRQVLIEPKFVEVDDKQAKELGVDYLFFQKLEGRDAKADVAMLVKVAPDKSAVVEATVLPYGRGADFRRWVPQNPQLTVVPQIGADDTIGMALRPETAALSTPHVALLPNETSKIYVNKPSAAAPIAPILFGIMGSQYEGPGAEAASSPGKVCPVTGKPISGDEHKRGGTAEAIDKAGMAAGMALLTSQSKGQMEGAKARWELSSSLRYSYTLTLKFDALNKNNNKTEALSTSFTLDPTAAPKAQGPIPALRISQSAESGKVRSEQEIVVTPYDGRKMRLIITNFMLGTGADSANWVPQNSQLEYAGKDAWPDFYSPEWDDFDNYGYCNECGNYEPEADIRNYDEDGYYHDPYRPSPIVEALKKAGLIKPDPQTRITIDPELITKQSKGPLQGERLTFLADFPVTKALFRTQAQNKETKELIVFVTPVLIRPPDAE